MRLVPLAPLHSQRVPGPSRLLYDVPDGAWGQDALLKVLAEAIRWCGPRARPEAAATCLRTNALQPRVMVDENRFRMMERVIDERRHALHGMPAPSEQPQLEGLLQGGRLVVYFPDDNLCDGAAELATGGFLDVDNMPPWDTWVGMFREDPESPTQSSDYLIAWVPPVFVEAVAQGIWVNPEVCIQWLEDSSTLMAKRLKDLR